MTCFEIEYAAKFSSEVCVDQASGTIARSSLGSTDDDFQPVGTKVFPRSLILNQDHHLKAKLNVSKLASPAEFAPDIFMPPAGVTPRAGCMNPLVPHAIDKPAPHYPTSAREQHRQGTVLYDVLIGKDGVPQLRRLLQSAGSDLDEATRTAISRWRYDPAMCGGQPVEAETVLQVNYTLSGH